MKEMNTNLKEMYINSVRPSTIQDILIDEYESMDNARVAMAEEFKAHGMPERLVADTVDFVFENLEGGELWKDVVTLLLDNDVIWVY